MKRVRAEENLPRYKMEIERGCDMNIKKGKNRILSVWLVLVMVLNLLSPCSIQAESEKETHSVQSQTETEKNYREDGVTITFQITNQWDGGFQTNVMIHNTKDKPVQNWALQFGMDENIIHIWNAVIYQHQGYEYIIKHAEHNQQIAAGQTVSFGFTVETEEAPVLPDTVKMVSCETIADEEEYGLEFHERDIWNSGFNGELLIHNNSSKDVEGWTLEFDFQGQIDYFWDALLIEHSQNHYVIKNRGYIFQ